MKPVLGRSVRGGLLLLAGLVLASTVAAQQFPSKTITVISPFPAGGIHDVYSRIIGTELQKRWGQSVVIDNRVGAGGWIGVQAFSKAPPDGHTLLAATHLLAVLPSFVKDSSFEPGKTIVPLTSVLYAPYVVITNTQVPVKTMGEFMTYMKANPGKFNFASVPNSSALLDTYDFLSRAGLDMTVVTYQGGAGALQAVLSNEVQAYFGAALGLESNVKAGKITMLAVTSSKPYFLVPEVPTVKATTGVDLDAGSLYSLHAVPGTPQPIVDKLYSEIIDIINNSEARAALQKLGYEIRTSTPQELAEIITREGRRGAEIARKIGIKAQ